MSVCNSRMEKFDIVVDRLSRKTFLLTKQTITRKKGNASKNNRSISNKRVAKLPTFMGIPDTVDEMRS